MKRKFILKLTGAVALLGMAVGCLVGCNSSGERETKYITYGDTETAMHRYISDATDYKFNEYILSDGPIVVNEGGEYVLHKGKVSLPRTYGNSGISLLPILEFECGKKIQTSQYTAILSDDLTAEEYDRVCDCAKTLVPAEDKEDNECTCDQCQKTR